MGCVEKIGRRTVGTWPRSSQGRKKRTGVRREVATWSSSSEINLGTGRVADGLNGLKGTRGADNAVSVEKRCAALFHQRWKEQVNGRPRLEVEKGLGMESGWGKGGDERGTWTSSKLSGFSGASKNIWPGPSPAIKGANVEKYGYGARLQGLRARGSRDTWRAPRSSSRPVKSPCTHPPRLGMNTRLTTPAHVAQVCPMPLDPVEATYASRTSDIGMDGVHCLDSKGHALRRTRMNAD